MHIIKSFLKTSYYLKSFLIGLFIGIIFAIIGNIYYENCTLFALSQGPADPPFCENIVMISIETVYILYLIIIKFLTNLQVPNDETILIIIGNILIPIIFGLIGLATGKIIKLFKK